MEKKKLIRKVKDIEVTIDSTYLRDYNGITKLVKVKQRTVEYDILRYIDNIFRLAKNKKYANFKGVKEVDGKSFAVISQGEMAGRFEVTTQAIKKAAATLKNNGIIETKVIGKQWHVRFSDKTELAFKTLEESKGKKVTKSATGSVGEIKKSNYGHDMSANDYVKLFAELLLKHKRITYKAVNPTGDFNAITKRMKHCSEEVLKEMIRLIVLKDNGEKQIIYLLGEKQHKQYLDEAKDIITIRKNREERADKKKEEGKRALRLPHNEEEEPEYHEEPEEPEITLHRKDNLAEDGKPKRKFKTWQNTEIPKEGIM